MSDAFLSDVVEPEPDLPGLDLALRPAADGTARPGAGVRRVAANLWELRIAGEPDGQALTVRVELDVCGAWVTLATEGRRPMVLRRAGWVDLRGQPVGSEDRWDRVGLGPGDSLVAVHGSTLPDDELMDLLLPHAQAPAADIAAAVADGTGEPGSGTVVVRVPVVDPEASLARVAAATGLGREHFARPLHPVGSPAAEIWRSRPTPPRAARMRLLPRHDAVPAARGLLRRLLASWRMEELLEGDIELLASELLTNGVVHARTDLLAVISYDGPSVRFEVHDRSSYLPELRVPSLEDEGGRGLWMVSALADRWAVEPTATGKRIWFEVAA